MNKTAIKNFAIWARNKLIADVSYDARLIGITEDGIAKPLPQSFGGTQFFDIGTAEPYSISGEAVRQRDKLIEVIQQKEKDTDYKTAYQYVIEEVAYTWFNRLIAIRFMEVNDYLPSHIRVLSSESGKLEPDLVTTPFDAELPFTAEEEAQIFQLKQDNKLDEVFRILFLKQCNALNEILPALFEKTKNYTELLLSLSVTNQDGVVYHLIHDIPEDDFNIERGGQVEIIGWLYQYYNTEPKAAAFAKNGKITKEEIPAVTQLFTPDWIVRYMVENSLGRLWVEGHPECDLKENWKYYLEEAQQEPEVQAKLAEIRKEYAALNPEDIKLIDPCMGSGHILVYAFDVLMQIYESAGYSQRDAAKSILENNIYGLDIDDRAYQLAYFAVMMKARQYNRRILNGENTCHVYAIQESNSINRAHLKYFGAGMDDIEKNAAKMQLEGLLDTLTDAKEYGSILNMGSYNWELLRSCAVRRQELVKAEAAAREAAMQADLLARQVPDAPEDTDEAPAPPVRSREAVSAQLAQVRAELEAARSAADRLTGRLHALGDPVVLQSSIQAMDQRRGELEGEYEAIRLAMDTLDDANTTLQNRFSPELGRRAAEIFRALTDGRYSGVVLDRAFHLSAEPAGDSVYRNAQLLSAGASDQLYLAVRLAICELVLPEEHAAPIILDDALANFDDDRCAAALGWLKEEGRKRQILLFTCHSREAAFFAGDGEVSVQRLTEA